VKFSSISKTVSLTAILLITPLAKPRSHCSVISL